MNFWLANSEGLSQKGDSQTVFAIYHMFFDFHNETKHSKISHCAKCSHCAMHFHLTVQVLLAAIAPSRIDTLTFHKKSRRYGNFN